MYCYTPDALLIVPELIADSIEMSGWSGEAGGGGVSLPRLRGLVERYAGLQQWESALYWADKLCSLAGAGPGEVWLVGRCLLQTRQAADNHIMMMSSSIVVQQQ